MYKHYKYISCLVTHFPQKCTNQDTMHMFTNHSIIILHPELLDTSPGLKRSVCVRCSLENLRQAASE